MTGPALTGGCQCGGVRFRVAGAPVRASVCHCRMCQKAFAAPFGAFASFDRGDVVWTRGSRKTFQSSDVIARGFCGDCGTPLTFETVSGEGTIALAICAFDDPAALQPQRKLGVESRIAWLGQIDALPTRSAAEAQARRASLKPPVSRQHPDHDT
jgi:hypothetical protein